VPAWAGPAHIARELILGTFDFRTSLIYADCSPSEHEREWVEAAFSRGSEAAAQGSAV
jgi:hypothetical protein